MIHFRKLQTKQKKTSREEEWNKQQLNRGLRLPEFAAKKLTNIHSQMWFAAILCMHTYRMQRDILVNHN